VELITIATVTIRSIWHNSAADFYGIFENFRRKFANLVGFANLRRKFLVQSVGGATSCGAIYRLNYESFSALLSTSGPLTEKTASKSMHNWRRYPSSNWYEIDQKRGSKFGALLWRHLTPQRKTAI